MAEDGSKFSRGFKLCRFLPFPLGRIFFKRDTFSRHPFSVINKAIIQLLRRNSISLLNYYFISNSKLIYLSRLSEEFRPRL